MKVFASSCKNCLLSKDSIVSPERRKKILHDCDKDNTFFVCHKSSIEGGNTCCNRYYKNVLKKIEGIEIAERMGMIEFEEQKDDTFLTPWRKNK